MKKTSIAMDPETRKLLDEYCYETGTQLSEAIRHLVKSGIELYESQKEHGSPEDLGPNSLMTNQKYSIRASIENTFYLRSIAKEILKDESKYRALIEEVDQATSGLIQAGWKYEKES